ncbi:pyrroline-5-carboxylate reductase [Robbsia andropogonis]|uniref:pyrroline-5-carboxylate reductase n=2 Tax=Robbsia andropogonis TaxID=28092 RepID=UPI00209DFCA1|nr:pyrroline-5-carboxylate reductase [Robbsia andropogonis]MCP1118952.1 pyrroline-5-carboxylate reductase [Robbsia andropogonis]MCP1128696.1 pyrroline-5-carboxylate reductase [Robbsia andropogonis]
MNIVFIGGGNMASAMIGGLLKQGHPASAIHVVDRNEEARARTRSDFGTPVSESLADDAARQAVSAADVIVLAVKPQVLEGVAGELGGLLQHALVLSIAAGVTVASLQQWLGGRYTNLIRVMPNTPALIGKGMTGGYVPEGVPGTSRDAAQFVLEAAGEVVWFDNEEALDAVTALSGSGPAYVFYFMEAMQQQAIELGLPPEAAHQMVRATFVGAAEMARQSPLDLAQLRQNVTSKGGTTAAAIAALDAGNCFETVKSALAAAHARSVEMRGG